MINSYNPLKLFPWPEFFQDRPIVALPGWRFELKIIDNKQNYLKDRDLATLTPGINQIDMRLYNSTDVM